MKLYKFRSLQNLNFILDILKNNRFYAAKFTELNDPMEGIFRHDGTFSAHEKRKLILGRYNRRICCFANSFNNPLLWAHYADSFKGICIEVDIKQNHTYKLEPVTYTALKPKITNDDKCELSAFIDKTFLRKHKIWKYEGEIRILSDDDFIGESISINAIYMGLRISEEHKWFIKKIIGKKVPTYETKISDLTNKVVKS